MLLLLLIAGGAAGEVPSPAPYTSSLVYRTTRTYRGVTPPPTRHARDEPVGLTDSVAIAYQPSLSINDGLGVSDDVSHSAVKWQQRAYRFRHDDGSETSATWKAATDAPVNVAAGETFRLRTAIANVGTILSSSATSGGMYLEQSVDGGEWTSVMTVGDPTAPIHYDSSPHVVDQEATTQQIGTASFVSGVIEETSISGFGTSRSLAGGQETEYEFVLRLAVGAVPDATEIALRVQRSGFPDLTEYLVTPLVTASGIAQSASVTDPLGLLDDVAHESGTTTAHSDTITDAISTVDSNVQEAAFTAAITDALGLTDFSTTGAITVVTHIDPLGLTDTVDQTVALARGPPDDALGLTDSVTADVAYHQDVASLLIVRDILTRPIGQLSDDFNDGTFTDKWTTPGSGVAQESGGRLRLRLDWDGGQVRTINAFDLTGSSLTIEAIPPPNLTDVTYLSLWFAHGEESQQLGIIAQGGQLTGYVGTNQGVTYDPVAHRWWRVREAAGTVYIETSPDRLTWTVLHSGVPTPFQPNSEYVSLHAVGDEYDPETNPDKWFEFDNLNHVDLTVTDTLGVTDAADAAILAIAATPLTSGSSTANQSTAYTTDSISPTAGRLILLTVEIDRTDSIDPVSPAIAGNGLTWVEVAALAWKDVGTTRSRLIVYRAMGSNPVPGPISISPQPLTDTHSGCTWSVVEFTGLDTSGANGSGAIVQVVAAKGPTATGTSQTVTLAAFADPANATFGAFAHDTNELHTPGAGFTELHDVGHLAPSIGMTTLWREGNDTTVDVSWATGSRSGGIAAELKAALPGAGTTFTDMLGLTDEVSHSLGLAAEPSNVLGLTDAIAINLEHSLTENLGLADATDLGLGLSIADPLGLTDQATAVATADRAHSDSLALTDDATSVITGDRIRTDTLGLTDDVSQAATLAPTQTDPLSLSDAVDHVVTYVVTVTDGLAASDETSYVGTLADSVSDQLRITDAIAAVHDAVDTRTDALGLTDSAVTTAVFSSSQTDQLTLTDFAAVAADSARDTSDSLGLVDSIEVGGAFVYDHTDALGLTDTVVGVVIYEAVATDALALADTVSSAGALTDSAISSLALNDSVEVDHVLGLKERDVTDSLGLADDLTSTLTTAYDVVVTDAIGLVDESASVSLLTVTHSDGLSLSDTVELTTAETPADPLEISDTHAKHQGILVVGMVKVGDLL